MKNSLVIKNNPNAVKQISALIPLDLHKTLVKLTAKKSLALGENVSLTDTVIEVLERGLKSA
jgi:hypothetical protein